MPPLPLITTKFTKKVSGLLLGRQEFLRIFCLVYFEANRNNFLSVIF
jgi:hypothetical protein